MASAPSADQKEVRLNVRYRGLDVDRGRMGALELGPAIFGVGQMVGRTSRVLYGDEARVKVEVRADFEHASFGIDFVAMATAQGLVPPLTMEDLKNINIVLGLVAGALGSARGVVWPVRELRGRKIDKVEVEGDQTNIHVEGDVYNVTINEYKVFQDPGVREGLRAIVDPMKSEGVEMLEIGVEGQEPLSISRGEREYFHVSALPEEEVSVDESLRVVEVISPAFREDNKWRFAEGGATYYAEIVDEGFLGRVQRHEITFGQGDALHVRMNTRTNLVDNHFTYERRIIEVLRHIKPTEGSQIDLLGTKEEDETR